MRLKFYLMGLGIGVIVAAVIMGIAMRGRTREMTDEEIMARARQLGMVEAGTLTELARVEDSQNNSQDNQNAAPDGAGAVATVTQPQSQAPGGTGNTGSAAGAASSGGADSMVIEGEPVDDETDETLAQGAGGSAEAAGASDEDDDDEDEDAADAARQGADADTSGNASAGASAQGGTGGGTGNSGAVKSSGDSGNGSGNGGAGSPGVGSVVVTIPDGLYSEDICALLEQSGVVDNARAFNDYLVNAGIDGYIGVGARLIPRGSSYEDVARIITGR